MFCNHSFKLFVSWYGQYISRTLPSGTICIMDVQYISRTLPSGTICIMVRAIYIPYFALRHYLYHGTGNIYPVLCPQALFVSWYGQYISRTLPSGTICIMVRAIYIPYFALRHYLYYLALVHLRTILF